MNREQVAVVKKEGRTAYDAVKEAVERIGGIGRFLKPGQNVILKPNYTGNVPEDTGGVTSLAVLEGILRMVKEAGAGSVTILEGCGTIALGTQKIYENLGVDKLARRYDAALLDANLQPMCVRSSTQFRELLQVEVAEQIFDGSLVINIPVMKTHPLVDVTVAMKNMNGLLSPYYKRHFHDLNLRRAIVEYHMVLPPYLTIVDGLTGMEGMGPVEGMPVPMDLVLAGGNPVAVDAVAARIMGFDPDQIVYLRYAAQAGLGPVAEQEIEICGNPVDKVRKKFAPAIPERVEYPGITIQEEVSATNCIGCRAVMSIALNRLRAAGDLPGFAGMHILINNTPDQEIQLAEDERLFCIGMCAKGYYDSHGGDSRICYVPGCAPAGLTVEDAFRDAYGIERKHVEMTAAR